MDSRGTSLEDAQQVYRQAPVNIGEREAFMGIAVCALASDGRIEKDRVKALTGPVGGLRMYEGFSVEELEFTLSRVARIGEEAGLDKLLVASARAVPDKLRDSAFAFAIDVLVADRELGLQEQVFLEKLRNKLHVDTSTATMIQTVARIRRAA